ncbi:unnamed protein product [Vitrella brassicaformis CCMP3155]|uniref:Uncharacterized protein n=1 Tax=Vitrella brassicaformis (strain CCMP3155) TaxID=1169540 RepID=A0A0G4EUF6_VITBC|nr:unnamed protein product [Vitrella brassicaformis CCMP3155]|eukprot:CEM01721.1 unnamed protein product [Vitrella brassicaformis CCMP3155]
MDTDDGGAAGGRPCVDGSGCRDVLHKIHSVASQIASDAERAEHIIATHADDKSQDVASLAGSLSTILDTLTDAQSALGNELAQMSSDRDTHRMEGDGRLFRCIHRVGGAVGGRAAEPAMPVPVGDGGKRACVAISPAAAAATANSKTATPRPMNKPKKYGRPSLSGLPEDVFSHLDSFVTSIVVSRLAKVNKETHQKATDQNLGMFRHFTLTSDEEETYRKVKGVREMQHMGKIQTAHIESSSVPACLSRCLEASRLTLTRLTVIAPDQPRSAPRAPIDMRRAPALPTHFPNITHMTIQSAAWLSHLRYRQWTFPNLRALRVGSIYESADLMALLDAMPMIERLEAACIGFYDEEQEAFLALLGGRPHLTTVTGLQTYMEECYPSYRFGCENEVKKAVDANWSKQDNEGVPKKLGFVVPRLWIGVDYGQQKAADVEAFRKWAEEVNCEVKWELGEDGGMNIDCSSSGATALPAPGGFFGDFATQMAAKAKTVCLYVGGSPLHESWRDKLAFPNAKKLFIEDHEMGVSASEAEDSIPTWLANDDADGERAACSGFPSVEHLSVGFLSYLSVDEMCEHPSKLSLLLGGLRSVRQVSFSSPIWCLSAACELLSYLPVTHLDEVTFLDTPEESTGVHIEGGLGCPRIQCMCSGRMSFDRKARVQSFLRLVLTLRPVSVRLSLRADRSDLQGADEAPRIRDLRGFACECFEEVEAHYSVTGGKIEDTRGGYYYTLNVQLAAK